MESALTKLLTFIANIFGVLIDGVNGAVLKVMGLNGNDTLDFFFGIFSASHNFMDLFKAIGVSLVFLIYLFQLFKTFFGPISTGTEHPVYLSIRAVFYTIFVLMADMITSMFVEIGTIPYKMMLNVDVSAQNLDEGIGEHDSIGANLLDPETGLMKHLAEALAEGGLALGIFGGTIVVFLGATMAGVIAYSYLKLALEIVERYIILAVLIMFAPLCIATGVSENTNRIMSGWFKMFISQLVLMSMSVFFLRMFSNGLTQIFANMGVTSFVHIGQEDPLLTATLRGLPGVFLGMLILFAWLRTAQRIDSHMSAIGMTAAQSGQGLGADLFRGIGATSGTALAAANKVGGTNYKNAGSLMRGEMGGAASRVKQGAGALGSLAMGKKPKASDDSILNYLQPKGEKGRSVPKLEQAAVKSTLANGGTVSGASVKDHLAKGGSVGAHAAVGAGIEELMGGAIPEGFEATEGSLDGDKGIMSASFTNEDGESFDAVFSKEPLGEGSVPITDADGDTWYATAQGDGAAEFYSGNSNSVDQAEGADAAEFAGGDTEMVQQGGDGEAQTHSMEADANGDVVETADGTLEGLEDGETAFMAEDINGDMHDVSDMVNDSGEFVEGGTMGTLDEDGNFVESEDGTGTHMQDEDGNVFAMAGEGEDGGQLFEEAGQAIVGEGEGASFMAEDVNGDLHDMSGQVDENGNYTGDGTMGTLDEDGNFVESEDGTGTHMQDEDGNVFAMENGGESFEEAGMYTGEPEGEPTTTAQDMAGNTQDISDHVDENGVVQGERFSMDEGGNMVPDENGNIVQTSDGSMFEVGADGQAVGAQTSQDMSYSKVGDSAKGMTGARFSQNEKGEMVPDSKGSYVQTSSGSFAPVNSNGTVNTYSATKSGSASTAGAGGAAGSPSAGVKGTSPNQGFVAYKNANGGTSYAKAKTNADGSVSTNANGSINLANGQTVPAGSYAKAAAASGGARALSDTSGSSFNLGEGSFDKAGNVQTYAPVMKDGKFAYDAQGNQQFEASAGGGFVQDANGNFREVGASSVNSPGVGAGSVMRNSAGETFTLGDQSVDSSGSAQTYAPVMDADGNVQTKNGEPQYQPAEGGGYVKDSNGNMQELAQEGTSGAFNFESKSDTGSYVKTAGGGTYQAPDGSNYAQTAPTTDLQTYEKTDQGYRPSPTGNYVQSVNEAGDASFQPIADGGQASNGAALRYSQTEDGGYVRDNNGSFVQTQGSSGQPEFSRVSDASVRQSSGVQRFSYDKASESYVPDAKGDSVQTLDKSGNVSYSKLDKSSISDKGVATFNKSIKNGAHSMPVNPAFGKKVEPVYNSSGTDSGSYFKSGGTMYNLNEPGSLKPDGSVQRYSQNENGKFYKDDAGKYIKGRAEGATTPTFRGVGTGPVERFDKGYSIGSAKVNEHGSISIGPKDKMVNNKDGTIDLQFADGRTAKLSNANMYKNTGDANDPAYAGTIQFGGSDYHYQDTTPAYKSFGANVKPGDPIEGKGFEDIKTSLQGDKDFIRTSNYGTGTYRPMKDYSFKGSDIQNGKIATYVNDGEGGKRLATEKEVRDASVEKFVQPRRSGGFVAGKGFGKNGELRESYISESKIQKTKIGDDGNLYIYNQPKADGSQDVYCAVSTKSGKVPKGNYDTKVINNEQYYVVKGQINPSKGKTDMNVQTQETKQSQAKFEMKKGVSIEKRAPVKYNAKVDDIIKK